MFKKIGFIFIAFLFILTYAKVSMLYAQEATPSSNIATASPSFIKYDLAYPGLLPDNPLYKLKVLRDKIMINFITDPRKKIDFYLLQTDKGILAAAMLIDKNKIDLASQTALKAEHNYTMLVMELNQLPNKPKADFYNRLQKASLKHQEVLNAIIKRVPSDKQKVFETVLDFSKRNLASLKSYQNQ